MKARNQKLRQGISLVLSLVSAGASLAAIGVLGWILFTVFDRGFAVLNLSFLMKLPTPSGIPGGGMANAIVGSLMITLLTALLAIPLGILAGIYLAEFSTGSILGRAIRFAVDMMLSIPSIIAGVFIWGVVVVFTGTFSGLAGALALMLIMLPVVTRTTEDMLCVIPNALRESLLAMGSPQWKMVLMLMKHARSGILTGILLGVARISGETAPLLFTALNSPYMPRKLMEPTANLPVTIFNYAMSPYSDWQMKAWGASLLITLFILGLSVLSRAFLAIKG